MKGAAPTNEILNLTAVLYSVSQDCYHIEKIQDYLKQNITVAMNGIKKSDYSLIGIFKSDVEGDRYIEMFKKVKGK